MLHPYHERSSLAGGISLEKQTSSLPPTPDPRSGRFRRGGRESEFLAGKTKADFFREERRALKPWQMGLFDDLPES